MAKDSFWFIHDSDAKDDPKLLQLRMDFGWESYGVYWCFIEIMRVSKNFFLKKSIIPALCKQYRIKKRVADNVLYNYDLFKFDGDYIYSESLIRRQQQWVNRKQKQSEGGKKGMYARYKGNSEELIL